MTSARLAVAILSLTLWGAGCSYDCTSAAGDITSVRGPSVVEASIGSDVDTLSVVFVGSYEPELTVSVEVGADVPRRIPSDGVVTLAVDAEGSVAGTRPRPLVPLASGDTLFVFVEGSVEPRLYTEACSPDSPRLRIDVRGLDVPETVQAVRIRQVRIWELSPAELEALRQADLDRGAVSFA